MAIKANLDLPTFVTLDYKRHSTVVREGPGAASATKDTATGRTVVTATTGARASTTRRRAGAAAGRARLGALRPSETAPARRGGVRPNILAIPSRVDEAENCWRPEWNTRHVDGEGGVDPTGRHRRDRLTGVEMLIS